MRIKGFEKISCVDYPQHIACVIFLGGCNLRCRYCYNTKLVLNTHQTPDIDKADILSYIKKRINVLEGICVSGGEPTVNHDLPGFLRELSQFGLPIKLDTNGTNPGIICSLIENGLVNYIALDIKEPFDASYTALTGIHADKIKSVEETLYILAHSQIEFEIRTTVIPTIHSLDILKIMISQVVAVLGPEYDITHINWYLQPFIPKGCLDSTYNDLPTRTSIELEEQAKYLVEESKSKYGMSFTINVR